MKINFKISFLITLFAFSVLFPQNKKTTEIFVNQIGYFPEAVKISAVISDTDTFRIFSLSENKVVYKGKLSAKKYWAQSDENVRLANFSEVTKPGSYVLLVDGAKSFPFEISANLYDEISVATLKAYYYQRASVRLPAKYAGKWKRKTGLPDTSVIVHKSAASKIREAGTKISAPKGWFDAGDYNKYIVSSAVTTYTLILTYEFFPDYFETLRTNIPESENEIPDILDEILWNVRWMMKMQDPTDGGVYHKLTCADFQPYVMPDKVKARRFVVGKSTAAALDFSAVLSHFSATLKKYRPELAALSDSCLFMARRAWNWAIENPDAHFRNPPDIFTGEYSDNDLKDNFFWAGIELYFATGDKTYLKYLDELDVMVTDSLYWKHVANFGILTVLNGEKSLRTKISNIAEIKNKFAKSVEKIYGDNVKSPYRISLDVFKWGSNANLLNETMMLLAAYKFEGKKKYLDAAITNLDYVLGKNPLNICYVTGFGKISPLHIHHRISEADGVPEPIPGFVVGGPNPNNTDDLGKEKYPSLLPAKCYLDDVGSYSTNEVAINWNAPLVFSLFAVKNFTKETNITFYKK